MRLAWVGVLAAGLFALVVESGSSYVLFRHYASLHRAYYPAGLASMTLLGFILKGGGRHDEVALAIDHAPLYRTDAKLGYALLSGTYRVTEQRGGLSHEFTITIDDAEHRITSPRSNDTARRLFIAGDSTMFGWGLNDEQTAPWLLQSRFPAWNVVNLSVTSYSTVHGMLQLAASRPPVGADDIVVLTYHPITNDFNVASADILGYLANGFEHQLGDEQLVRDMRVPFGKLVKGEVELGKYAVACGTTDAGKPNCSRTPCSPAEAKRVTEKVFDSIMHAHPAHYVVAFLSGEDEDTVIRHLRNTGAVIADLRTVASDSDANDEVSIDEDAGPFWHHLIVERLAHLFVSERLVD